MLLGILILKVLITVAVSTDFQQNSSDSDCRNLSNIVLAASEGNQFAVREFLTANSSNSNFVGEDNWTALHWACRNGDVSIATLLIEHGADVNATLINGTTALQWAAWAGQPNTMQILINFGAHVDHRDINLRWTALHWAASTSNETVSVLLNAGCEIDCRGRDGLTPLHVAVLHEKNDSALLLMKHGAAINVENDEHGTPLLIAVVSEQERVVAALLEHGANPNSEHDGDVVLFHAANAENENITQLLLNAGADANRSSKDSGLTPLHIAARTNRSKIVSILLNAGADSNAMTNFGTGVGSTPLQMASALGHYPIVEMLLNAGADVNRTDSRGRSATFFARQGGHLNIAELLAKHGADQSNPAGDTDDNEPRIRIGIFGIPMSAGGGGLGGFAELEKLLESAQSGSGEGPGEKRRRFDRARNISTRFHDVAGCDEAKEELADLALFLRNTTYFTRLGGKIPKGYLLSGRPGTGKTLLARAVAGEAGVPFIHASGSDFEEVYAGLGAARVRELFAEAREEAPCIVFIDEIDAVGSRRAARADRQDSRQTLNQLLSEMDGFKSSDGVVVLAATNMPEVLDPALTRPGRFDRHVVVPLPDQAGRQAVLRTHLRGIVADPNVDPELLARASGGMSGADLAGIVNQAALAAAKEGRDAVSMADLESARDRHVMGAERGSAVVPALSKEATAYHEAGHALVAVLTSGSRPVHRVTVVPRGQALGMVAQLPEDGADYRGTSRREYKAAIAVCMAGRAAEELVYGPDGVTDGAAQDLEQAAGMAAAMVERFGMGPTRRAHAAATAAASSRSWWAGAGCSESARAAADAEVEALVTEARDVAMSLLRAHQPALHALARELVRQGTLDGDQVRALLAQNGASLALPSASPARTPPWEEAAGGGWGLILRLPLVGPTLSAVERLARPALSALRLRQGTAAAVGSSAAMAVNQGDGNSRQAAAGESEGWRQRVEAAEVRAAAAEVRAVAAETHAAEALEKVEVLCRSLASRILPPPDNPQDALVLTPEVAAAK